MENEKFHNLINIHFQYWFWKCFCRRQELALTELKKVIHRQSCNRRYRNRLRYHVDDDSWFLKVSETSDYIFRKKYRMTKNQFNNLALKIEKRVGTSVFNSERFHRNVSLSGEKQWRLELGYFLVEVTLTLSVLVLDLTLKASMLYIEHLRNSLNG